MWVVAWWTRLLWLVVVALWLPATMHCSLEAAGWIEADCCAADHGVHGDDSHGPEPEGSDACPVCLSVEDGTLHRLPEVLLSKPSGDLLFDLVWEANPRSHPPATGEDWNRGANEDWRPPWWCRLRVAAPPRAPTILA